MARAVFSLVAVALVAAGCSRPERPAEVVHGNYPPPDATAVVDPLSHYAPFAGTMMGHEFVPRGAIAIPAVDAGKKTIVLTDYPLTCASNVIAPPDGSRRVTFDVPWRGGASVDLAVEPATIQVRALGDWHDERSSGGHVDVQTASPTIGQTGRLYVRVDHGADKGDRIEGVLEVRVCG